MLCEFVYGDEEAAAEEETEAVTAESIHTAENYDTFVESLSNSDLTEEQQALVNYLAGQTGYPTLQEYFNAVKNGEELPPDWTGTIETGSVELTELNEAVAAEGTADKIEEVKAGLADGSIHVYDTANWTKGGTAMDSYMADVDTDPNYEGDTEVISDGYFHESEFRSAPYFDIQIDGINLLDTAF